MVKEKPEQNLANYVEKVFIKLDCAQIVPVKVKTFKQF